MLSEQFSYCFYYSAHWHEFYLILFLVESFGIVSRDENALEAKLLCLGDALFYTCHGTYLAA